MDKRDKLPKDSIEEILEEKGLDKIQIKKLVKYMSIKNIEDLVSEFPDIKDSK
jgi:ribosomal protein L12E/L44/L45/RPP1/RPP2